MIIIDYKTGGEIKPSHLLQMAAYKQLLKENHPVNKFTRVKHDYKIKDKIIVSTTNALQIWVSHYVEHHIFNNAFYMNRGIYVHKAIPMLDEGILDFDNVNDIAKPYIDSYIKFKAENDFMELPFKSEQSFKSELYNYCGTIDRVINDGLETIRTICVYLCFKGHECNYKLKEYKCTEKDFNAFRACLSLYKYNKK